MGAHVLMDKDGKYVTVYKYKKELTLCAVECQEGNEPLLDIRRRVKDKKKQLALVFKRDGLSYVPKVEEGELKIEQVGDYEKLADRYWFEKENLGNNEHYSLRSVVESRQYLKECWSFRNVFTFTLSDSGQDCTAVTDSPMNI